MSKGMVEGLVRALNEKQSELNVHLEDITLSFGNSPVAVKLSGDITLTIHMRELTKDEKAALAASHVAALQA